MGATQSKTPSSSSFSYRKLHQSAHSNSQLPLRHDHKVYILVIYMSILLVLISLSLSIYSSLINGSFLVFVIRNLYQYEINE